MPDHFDGLVGCRNLLSVRAGLSQREQGIGLAPAKQGGHRDAIGDAGRRRCRHQFTGLVSQDSICCGGGICSTPVWREASAISYLTVLGDQSGTKEQPAPQLLEDAYPPACGRVAHRLAEQRGLQIVPGDVRGYCIHSIVVTGSHERQRPAVRATRETDSGIAGPVLGDGVQGGEVVDHSRGVGDLEVRRVHGDGSGGPAESSCGVGQDNESTIGQVLRISRDRSLAAAEAVSEDHGGSGCGRWQVEIGVESHWRRVHRARRSPGQGQGLRGRIRPGLAAHGCDKPPENHRRDETRELTTIHHPFSIRLPKPKPIKSESASATNCLAITIYIPICRM